MAKDVQKTETAAPADSGAKHTAINRHNGWLYGLGAMVVLIVVFLAGLGLGNHRWWNRDVNNAGIFGIRAEGLAGPHRFMMGGGYAFNNNAGGQTRDSGVVTSVSGSGFTIAANGATTSVVTNSSTQYRGGNNVKQNDSVIVWGTESNGSLTATEVVINP